MMNYLLVGRMGSGKDTVASLLREKKPVAFASELKRLVTTLRTEGPERTYSFAKDLFLEEPEDLMEALCRFYKYPREVPKERKLLQNLGTNYCRTLEPDIWVRALKRRMEPDTAYVITDCRFPNEKAAFPDFVSIQLCCSDETRHQRIAIRDGLARDRSAEELRDKHLSESFIDSMGASCTVWLDTDCSREELDRRVRDMQSAIERRAMLLAV